MRTHKVPLESIKPDWQTQQILKTYGTGKVNKMARSLQDEGQKEPIVVDPTLTQIRDGFTRYLAAKRVGLKEFKVTEMTDEEWWKERLSKGIAKKS